MPPEEMVVEVEVGEEESSTGSVSTSENLSNTARKFRESLGRVLADHADFAATEVGTRLGSDLARAFAKRGVDLDDPVVQNTLLTTIEAVAFADGNFGGVTKTTPGTAWLYLVLRETLRRVPEGGTDVQS